MAKALNCAMELEHAIGFSGIPGGVHYHPNASQFAAVAGGSVVLTAFEDTHDQTILRGHDALVSACAMSPQTGGFFATGQNGENADVVVWRGQDILYRFAEHDLGIAALGFSHDELLLASVGDDAKLFVWDLATGAIVATAAGVRQVRALAWGGFARDVKRRDTTDYVFVSVGTRQLTFWTCDPVRGTLRPHPVVGSIVREYTCVAFTHDRECVVAGTTSGDFVLVQVKGYRMTRAMDAQVSGGIQSVATCGEGVLVGGGNGTVRFYDAQTWADRGLAEVRGAVTSLSVASDGLEVLAGTSRGLIYRLSLGHPLKDGAIMPSLLVSENHSQSVVKVVYADASSERFATISRDGTVRVWDASDYSVLATAVVQGSQPTSLAYTPDILISGWLDGHIRCHASEHGAFLWNITNAHADGVSALALSHNERFLVTGGVQGDLRVWDVRKRDLVSHLKEHSMPVTDLRIFQDDLHVLSCSRDKSLLCWDLRGERRISSHTQRMGGLNALTLAAGETQVLTVGQERRVSVWDLRLPSPVRQFQNVANPADSDEAMTVAVAHALALVATGGSAQSLHLWDLDTGSLITSGVGHSGTIRSLAFSPDDRQLVSVGEDGSVLVWNIYTI